jgi:hypothetical protein
LPKIVARKCFYGKLTLRSGASLHFLRQGFLKIKSVSFLTSTYFSLVKSSNKNLKMVNRPPYRAEHMGSLLRPSDLLEVRAAIQTKNISAEQAGLPSVERAAVEYVIKFQQKLGFKAVTDGEFVRTRFWGLMWDEFGGTTRLQDADASMFRLYHPDVVSLIEKDRKVMPGDSVIAGAKLYHDAKASVANLHELQLTQSFVPKEEWGSIKLTMITPAWFRT